MEIITLPKTSFSVTELQDKFNNGMLKDNLDAMIYVQQYFYETKNGMYYFYDADKDAFEFKTDKDFKKEVVDKIDDKNFTSKLKKNDKIYQVVSEIGKPRIYQIKEGKYTRHFINEAGAFLHQKYKKFDEYSDKTKKAVYKFLAMMKELSCNNNEDMFKAYILYYAQLARGKKTEVIIYRKTPQEGVGKSTETDFIMEFVFGLKVCLLCSTAEPLLTSFNKIFMGKLLIIFEELPVFTDSQWSGVACKLKTLTTEKITVYRDVYEKPIQSDNISNFQINTNVNALKDSQGRRIIILDFNVSRKGDYKFFEDIRKECFNMEVGEAFYSYLVTKITDEEVSKFYGQRDFPETDGKRIAKANQLNSICKFLKFDYVLKKKGITKILRQDFFTEYCFYCEGNKLKSYGKNDFFKTLEVMGIKATKNNGNWYIVEKYDKLQKIADDEKWICEYDEYEAEKGHGLDNDKDNEQQLKKENAELKNEIEQLKKQIEILTQQQVKPEVKPEVKQSVEDAIEQFDKKSKAKKAKTNKSTFSMDELQKKVKEDNKPQKLPIEDIDDGYSTDDLEMDFNMITKQLKK